MKKKILFIGMVALALLLTSGTFAYTYSFQSTTDMQATLADDQFSTYDISAAQPKWDSILPGANLNQERLIPVAAGDATEFPSEKPDCGEHYLQMADFSAPDTDTYITTQGTKSWVTDLYTMNPYTGMGGAEKISGVTIYYRVAAQGDYSVTSTATIKTNGSIYQSAVQTTTGNTFQTYTWILEKNPITGEAWTAADLNSLQIGVSGKGSSKNNPLLCTYVYAIVNYSYKIIQGAVPLGALYDVKPAAEYTGDLMVKIYITNTANLLKAYNYLNIKVYVPNTVESEKTPDYQVLSIENGVIVFNIIGGSANIYSVQVVGGAYRLNSAEPSDWCEDWSVVPEFYCEVSQR
jgi:hypothetical protein